MARWDCHPESPIQRRDRGRIVVEAVVRRAVRAVVELAEMAPPRIGEAS